MSLMVTIQLRLFVIMCWSRQYGSNLVRHLKKRAFTEFWTRYPNHNPESTYALDRLAMAPLYKWREVRKCHLQPVGPIFEEIKLAGLGTQKVGNPWLRRCRGPWKVSRQSFLFLLLQTKGKICKFTMFANHPTLILSCIYRQSPIFSLVTKNIF